MPALLLLLLVCLAVPSLSYSTPCRLNDDSGIAELEYKACIASQIRRLDEYHNALLSDVGSYGNDLDLDLMADEDDGAVDDQFELRGWNPRMARMLKKFGQLKADVKRNSEGKLSEEELLKMVSDYYQWRKRNGGHGSSSGRWGRSTRRATPIDLDQMPKLKHNLLRSDQVDDKQRLGRFLQLLRRHGKLPKLREAEKKREDPVLAEYKQWRGQNGYGQASGRWG